MECPYCKSERIIVIKTKNYKYSVVRDRYCNTCEKYFKTIEIYKELMEDYIKNIL